MPSLNPNLKDYWLSDNGKLRRARHRVLYGGRASSKSWEFAGRIAQIGQEYKTRVLCVRRFQNRINDSVYTLIKNQIDNFGLGGYHIGATSISHANGSEMIFYGIERNTDEIKSFEGADVLWIEEAHNLTDEQWQILAPTIRKEGSEIWVSFNPRFANDFVYKRFVLNPPDNSIVRLVNYPDNPFLSQTMLDEIAELKRDDPELYEHVYLGVPKQDDDSVVIKRKWLNACLGAAEKLGIDAGGASSLGYDVADSGADKNASALFKGRELIGIDEWKAEEDELVMSCKRVLSTAKTNKAWIVYDSIGVGALVGSQLNELGYKSHNKFIAGAKVANPSSKYAVGITNIEKFENLKAQAWQLTADRARKTYNAVMNGEAIEADDLLSIKADVPHLERLLSELSEPRKRYSKRGLDMIETKDELKARGVDSPNLADAFIMGDNINLVKRSFAPVKTRW